MILTKLRNGVTLVMLGIPLVAAAAEWSAEPKIRLITGYNDNIRLTSGGHDAVWESSLAPSIKLGVATETDGVSADGGFAIRRFTGGSGNDSGAMLNREDYHLNTSAFHKTETDNFGFNVNYTRDSTLDSELDQGIIASTRVTRNYLVAGPSWSSAITPLTRLDANYQAYVVSYGSTNGISNLVDYDYHAATGTLSHQLTPRSQGLLAVGYTRYLPDSDFKSSTLSLQAGVATSFNETLTASVQAGQSWTSSDTPVASGFCIGADPGAAFPACTGGRPIPNGKTNTTIDSTSAVYSASLTKTLETGKVTASLSRSSAPSSTGELLNATRLLLSGEYRLSETLRSNLKIEYTQNETIANSAGQPSLENKTFSRISPGVSWNWRREWSLSGEYQYANVDYGTGIKADRNAVYLTLSYQPLKKSISR
jgi:hypothetical protein